MLWTSVEKGSPNLYGELLAFGKLEPLPHGGCKAMWALLHEEMR